MRIIIAIGLLFLGIFIGAYFWPTKNCQTNHYLYLNQPNCVAQPAIAKTGYAALEDDIDSLINNDNSHVS